MAEPGFQQTIGRPVALTGFGYWSSLDVSIEFRPAAENTGIRFVRCDLPGNPVVPANIRYRVQSPRRTTLSNGNASVEMIEHVMAALSALRIDNCEVVVNRAEMPGFDGSSRAFVEALDRAGICRQDSIRSLIRIREPIRIGDDERCWIQIEPCDEFRITYLLDYPGTVIGSQSFDIRVTPETFREEIAAARTFLLRHEAEWLLQQGLGQRVSYRHVLVFDERGPIDNELRFSNECVRHKTLDVIGDFALCGHPILGHVTACRSGHRLNGELARRVLQHGAVLYAPPFQSATGKSA